MMKFMLIALLFLMSNCYSQAEKNIAVPSYMEDICIGRLAIIRINYLNDSTMDEGICLVIDNSHVLTAAHIPFHSNKEISSIKIIQVLDNNAVSTNIDFKSYEYKKQMSESNYNYKNDCTDFIVLPLSKKVTFKKIQFDTSKISIKDT